MVRLQVEHASAFVGVNGYMPVCPVLRPMSPLVGADTVALRIPVALIVPVVQGVPLSPVEDILGEEEGRNWLATIQRSLQK